MTENEKQKMIELLNETYESDRLWFILGSLISAHNFMAPDKEKLQQRYKLNIELLQDMHDCVNESNLPKDIQKKVKNYTKSGIKILTNELNTL